MKADKSYYGHRIISISLIILCITFFNPDNKKNKPALRNTFGSVAYAKAKKSKYFTLNFKDADITEFLNIMSQLIGKNIIVDDKVRGKVTISSVKKFPVSQAYEILKQILEVKGLAVVETPELIKIIPVKDAIKKNAEIIIDGKKHEIKPQEEKTQTVLLKIENTDANEIVSVLKSLKSKQVDVTLARSQNRIIISGLSSEVSGLVKIAQELDKELEEEEEEKIVKGNIHIVHLENADAEQLAGVLARIPFSENAKIDTSPQIPSRTKRPVRSSAKTIRTTRTQPTAAPRKPTTKLSIIANKDTNSLIITATPDEFREIKRIIKELDSVREQVLIEALIVEISADKSWGLGIDWMLGGKSGSDMFGGSSIMGVPPNYNSTEGVPAGKSLALPLSQGFQLGFLSGESVLGFALLNLSETDKNFNVLSTPQILTIDNHEAELNIGEEIPITSNTRITNEDTVFNTYEYKSVGIKLKLTPHITHNNRITLDLYQEANDVIGVAEGGTTLPTLTKRDIQTKVTITDGKTIVIGGLIKNKKTSAERKVPFLGDIPILGWLFKRQDVSYQKTNLLVFITPHIVTKQEAIDAITEQKREEQRRLKIK